MSTSKPESLEGQAARLRAHLLSTTALIERRSQHHLGAESARHPEDAEDVSARQESSDQLAADAAEGGDEVDTTEREHLEQRADQVREHLTDNVEEAEAKVRQRLLPIAVIGGTFVLLYSVAFAWMFYRTARAARREWSW